MSQYFQKPENALKRAEELISVGLPEKALSTLRDVLGSKKHRTFTPTMTALIRRHLQLCVDLRKSKMAKDGLVQYRFICQTLNADSLETVIREFIAAARARADDAHARAKSLQLDGVDFEDDDNAEAQLMSSVTGEDSKDRSDREIVTPWLKFLWDSYRAVLELLRTNGKLEQLYHDTARQAFEFCLRFRRMTEFRRMCEILRTHVGQIIKYAHQPQNQVQLTNHETLVLFLETRVEQLNVAVGLSAWQEAFRTVEDYHGLTLYARRALPHALQTAYFTKLANLFWVSSNMLFHAYVQLRLFYLGEVDAQVVMAALLVIPPSSNDAVTGEAAYLDMDPECEKNSRTSSLLGLTSVPTRATMLDDFLNRVESSGAKLPEWLRAARAALDGAASNCTKLVKDMTPVFDALAADEALVRFVEPMRQLTLMRLLIQSSQVYGVMRINRLTELAGQQSFLAIERVIVRMTKKGLLRVRISHQEQTVTFLDHQPVDEGSKVRGKLTELSRRLETALNQIDPKRVSSTRDAKVKAFEDIQYQLDSEHKELLERKAIIEERRTRDEMRQKKLDEEAARVAAAAAKKHEQEELARLAEEAARREENRIRAERDEAERAEAQKMIDDLQAKQGGKALKSNLTLEEVATMSGRKALMDEQRDLAVKEKRKQEERLAGLAKRLDFIERARRLEEIPLLEEWATTQQSEDKKLFDARQQKIQETHKARHVHMLEEKKRLGRMAAERKAFEERMGTRRQAEFEKAQAAQAERNAAAKAQYKKDSVVRKQEREARMRREEQYRRDREEKEERARREKEEKDRRDAERRAEKEARAAEMREMAERSAAKQRAREAEIEAKMAGGGGSAPPSRGPPPRVAGGGGWREREAAGGGDAPPPRVAGGGGWREREAARGGGEGGGFGRRDEGGFGRREGGGGGGGWREREASRGGGDGGGFGRREGGFGGDRYGDRGGDRYGGDRGGDRYGGDRYGDRGGRGGDRYGGGGDRYGGGGDRYGGGGDRGGRGGFGRREDGYDATRPERRDAPPQRDQPRTDDDGFTQVRRR